MCELARATARQPDLHVVLFGGWCQSKVIRELRATEQLQLVFRPRDLKVRLNGAAWVLSTWWRRRTFAATLRADPETVYHPGLYAWDPWIARRAPKLVATVYDMQLEVQGARSRATQRQVREKAAVCARADHIFCISDSTRRDLERIVPAAIGKTSVAHLGAGLEAPRDVVRAGGAPFFVMVGGRHSYKNGRLALEAFAEVAAQHPDVRLKLCGGPPPGTDGELDFPGAEAIRARIDWEQPDDRALATAYANAVALIYPSTYEGFGLPILEAMICDCPVVTTTSSSLPEVGGDAALYFEPTDRAQLATQMRRLLGDAAFRAGCIARGREQAKKFSWDQTAAKVVAVCRGLFARR